MERVDRQDGIVTVFFKRIVLSIICLFAFVVSLTTKYAGFNVRAQDSCPVNDLCDENNDGGGDPCGGNCCETFVVCDWFCYWSCDYSGERCVVWCDPYCFEITQCH